MATFQRLLCSPSVGASPHGDQMFDEHCGQSNATTVCPGSIVQVQYTLANYSTDDVDVTANMWLSRDAAWDSLDIVSPTTTSYTVTEAALRTQNGWL